MKFATSYGSLALLLVGHARSIPIIAGERSVASLPRDQVLDDWKNTLSSDTRHRLNVALQHLDDETDPGQAFRNDTIMRVNIEREALDLPLVDLAQAFGMRIPATRATVSDASIEKRGNAEDIREEAYLRSGAMTYPLALDKRGNAEDIREEAYLRSGAMTYPLSVDKRDDAEDIREEAYLRSGAMTYPLSVDKRDDAEGIREEAYLRSGAMTYPLSVDKRDDAEDIREEAYLRSGAMTYPLSVDKRGNAEDIREEAYVRSGAMTYPKALDQRGNDAEDIREEAYVRSGAMTYPKALDQRGNDAEDIREEAYLRSGAMTYPLSVDKRGNEAEDIREEAYLRSGAMTYPLSVDKRGNNAEDIREEAYLRSGAMTYPLSVDKRDNFYDSLLDRDNLALGAIERVNIAHRVLGKPEITAQEADENASHSDEYLNGYWQSSMKHGDFWTTDQPAGKPNFIEGGQSNGFGFTQSTYHKLHCLANLRMMLAWHITGNGDKMTRDMNAHAMHCLDYTRWRELANPDLNEEPIDTVDYKGMGIH